MTFCHVMHLLLALASCNEDGTVNGTTTFVSSIIKKKFNITFWSCDAIHMKNGTIALIR